MSKAQRWKQQQKDAKQAAAAKAAKGPIISEPYQQKTLRERQAENKAQLAKHQASMAKLKQFEDKLHPKPAGEAVPEKEKSALDSMFYDGGNLSKDQGRTSHVALGAHHHPSKDVSPITGSRTVGTEATSHEKDTAIKPAAK